MVSTRIRFLLWHSVRPLSREEVAERLARVRNVDSKEGCEEQLHFSPLGHFGMAVWYPEELDNSVMFRSNGSHLALIHPSDSVIFH